MSQLIRAASRQYRARRSEPPMIEVNPIKRGAAALLHHTGLTALSFALQRSAFSPFIRVVYYHDVPAEMSAAFAAQLTMLKRTFVPASKADLARLLDAGHWPHDRPGIIVTFDDGLRSHSEVAAPVLDQLGYEGWFFVPIDLVSRDPAEQPEAAVRHGVIHYNDTSCDPRVFMSEQQLVSLSQRHNIGCHTATHLRLSRDLTEVRLQLEIDSAKQRLEAVLGRDVDSFSWVGGEDWAYSREAAERIASRFQYVFTTNTCVTRPGSSRLRIDRTHIEAPFSASLVRLQLSGMMDLYYHRKRRRVNSRLAALPGAPGRDARQET
jgi:peptidoglycan/xylan/chitin deacetylase (PgdA/CDA1 family)